MKKLSKLEIVASISLIIGILSYLSQNFFYIEALKNPYGLGDFLLILGVLLWCRILWKKREMSKEKS